jgi:hypothetical protein
LTCVKVNRAHFDDKPPSRMHRTNRAFKREAMDNSNTRNSRVLTAVLGGFAAAALIATVAIAPRQAAATPAYAAQTKKACGFCHVNPAGSGPRTPAGTKFEQNGHKL